MPLIEVEYITREYVRSHTDQHFLFGDNLQRGGFGGQAREMRGEPNTIGIITKRAPSMREDAFLSDEEWPMVRLSWGHAARIIIWHLTYGGTVVIPKAGLGTGYAQLPIRAPYIAEQLVAMIDLFRVVGESPIFSYDEVIAL